MTARRGPLDRSFIWQDCGLSALALEFLDSRRQIAVSLLGPRLLVHPAAGRSARALSIGDGAGSGWRRRRDWRRARGGGCGFLRGPSRICRNHAAGPGVQHDPGHGGESTPAHGVRGFDLQAIMRAEVNRLGDTLLGDPSTGLPLRDHQRVLHPQVTGHQVRRFSDLGQVCGGHVAGRVTWGREHESHLPRHLAGAHLEALRIELRAELLRRHGNTRRAAVRVAHLAALEPLLEHRMPGMGFADGWYTACALFRKIARDPPRRRRLCVGSGGFLCCRSSRGRFKCFLQFVKPGVAGRNDALHDRWRNLQRIMALLDQVVERGGGLALLPRRQQIPSVLNGLAGRAEAHALATRYTANWRNRDFAPLPGLFPGGGWFFGRRNNLTRTRRDRPALGRRDRRNPWWLRWFRKIRRPHVHARSEERRV